MTDYPSYINVEKRMSRRQNRQRRDRAIAWTLLMALLLVLATVMAKAYLDHRQEVLDQHRVEVEALEIKLDELKAERNRLATELDHRNKRFVELTNEHLELYEEYEQMTEVLQWERRQMTITHYAPLAPDAVEGMDYSGDPRLTSSGEATQIGVSVAAGPEVPFGTKVYIPGYGFREVHDRGGAVGLNRIDVAVASRSEAFRLGRVKGHDVYVEVEQ